MIKITRRQARAWLAPMRAALRAMRAGEVDAVRGYPVTRMNLRDDYVRIDFCIAGFRGLIERLEIAVDLTPLATIEKRLAAGVLFTVASIDHALASLRQVEAAGQVKKNTILAHIRSMRRANAESLVKTTGYTVQSIRYHTGVLIEEGAIQRVNRSDNLVFWEIS